MDQPSTAEPTLDHARTDQLRTFLTLEAAADAATSPTRPIRSGRRRLVGGIAAAVVLGAGLFVGSALAGGPSSGPARVATANAVAIRPATDTGWTKITISDIDADPDAVVAQLRAAGIDARRAPLPFSRPGDGQELLGSADETTSGAGGAGGGGVTMVGVGETGSRGLAGLTISTPAGEPAPLSDDLPPHEDAAAFNRYLEGLGARSGTDGSIEIRNDADVTVLVLSED